MNYNCLANIKDVKFVTGNLSMEMTKKKHPTVERNYLLTKLKYVPTLLLFCFVLHFILLSVRNILGVGSLLRTYARLS